MFAAPIAISLASCGLAQSQLTGTKSSSKTSNASLTTSQKYGGGTVKLNGVKCYETKEGPGYRIYAVATVEFSGLTEDEWRYLCNHKDLSVDIEFKTSDGATSYAHDIKYLWGLDKCQVLAYAPNGGVSKVSFDGADIYVKVGTDGTLGDHERASGAVTSFMSKTEMDRVAKDFGYTEF